MPLKETVTITIEPLRTHARLHDGHPNAVHVSISQGDQLVVGRQLWMSPGGDPLDRAGGFVTAWLKKLAGDGDEDDVDADSAYERPISDYVGDMQIGPGAALIIIERHRHTRSIFDGGEGYCPEHDDAYVDGELRRAAIAYAMHSKAWWPFKDGWKPTNNPIKRLVKAGGLLAAEIDRRYRAGESYLGEE